MALWERLSPVGKWIARAMLTVVVPAIGAAVSWVMERSFGPHLLFGALGGFGVILIGMTLVWLLSRIEKRRDSDRPNTKKLPPADSATVDQPITSD